MLSVLVGSPVSPLLLRVALAKLSLSSQLAYDLLVNT